MSILILIPIVLAVVDLVFVLYIFNKINRSEKGEGKALEIAKAIQDGAKAFLIREFKTMAIVFILVAIVLGLIQKTYLAPLMFLFGAVISSLTGYLGMMVSTMANVKTAHKAQKNFAESFNISIWGGEVMGFLVVGLGLLGIILAWGIFTGFKNAELLINYAFGASFVALFMRVGGGIFTKSADVGADLVGKTELGIPEDDPRNPAVIADNVGDNVGDIAGMGSDLFESYVSSIAAAMVIGSVAFIGNHGIFLPLLLASVGLLSSLAGSLFIKVSKELVQADFTKQTAGIRKAMGKGIILANVLMIIGSFLVIHFYVHNYKLFIAVLLSVVSGYIIGKSTEYYTSEQKKPTQDIAIATQAGPSGVILEGLTVGMKSSVIPVISVAVTIVFSYHFAGLYGIALAGVGILGVLGINLSTDCYGPIADNAAGISEMADLPPEARQRTEALDAVGNSTAAAGKGFAIGSAALAALAWLVTFAQQGGLSSVNLFDAKTIAGVFIGAMLPFLFASLTMKSVSHGALEIVNEVRRQFKEKKGLIDGTEQADHKACIDLATKRSLKEMSFPALLVIVVPIIIGVIFGKAAVTGALLGALSSGFILAIFMANAGGAWDNAKKYIEAGNLGGKGSEAHKAAVIGDTIGDPFKDTAGPSLNILIKLIGVVALLSLPLFI